MNNSETNAHVLHTYADYERQITTQHLQVGCILVMALMPAGVVLDYFVYHDKVAYFFALRLACVVLEGLVLAFMRTSLNHRFHRGLGLVVALLPVFFICWMIAVTEGVISPYYAGLNLILLAIAFVLRWSVGLSLLAFILILAMYLAACRLHTILLGPSQDVRILLNNLYFLTLTGIIVLTGSRIHRVLRIREFTLRFELDQSKQMLEESNQKLKELDQIKSRFFANISHELRTPLTLLIAPLENLLQRFRLDNETKDLLGTMHSNGMRLLKLINDLLDLVRLESGRMEVKREPLEVAEFVKGLASAARQVADDKRLRLETSVDAALGSVLADRDKLEKIVLNLVFNALKFTPSGGRVELRAEKRGDEFFLTVTDTGMGISAKNLPHIFDRFWQADGSSKRKYQGVGIGLALVKELVEIQGGQVTVESQEGKGTIFSVRLPYQKAEAATKSPATSETEAAGSSSASGGSVTSEEWLANLYRRAELFPALTPVQETLRPIEVSRNGNQPTLLVADDEPDMLRFLKSQLSSHYRVLEAVDGQQAVEKASQFLPDIILLDMMMPEKDGLQACREIREHTPTQSIPIVLLTARADEETKLAALSAGASDFLAKPFSTTELRVRIKNLVESHQYQRKVSKQNQVLESTIEQLKETETQLVQSEKLASLGRMSAGIIHEINNPLNFATTGLFTLRNKGKHLAPDQQEEYMEILKDVEDGIVRVKNIVSDLRMFTHPETESRDQVEIADVVNASLRFLSNEWKDKVQIEQKLTEHQTIWANKNKLIHVLVNLLQNSLDALKNKNFDGEKPTITVESRVEPGKSILIVRDNGIGISNEHLDKIFDPFYTTKDVGQGMGLGLSICYRIVQDCEGRIGVRTEPGKFCEFTLEFPAKG
ncbi:MAG TPA: ATP-binding protein [Candidatus Limnocylindrales bacterium]|nr:ATP-binding protein [Candidatus Limnocylindrales bacterium]